MNKNNICIYKHKYIYICVYIHRPIYIYVYIYVFMTVIVSHTAVRVVSLKQQKKKMKEHCDIQNDSAEFYIFCPAQCARQCISKAHFRMLLLSQPAQRLGCLGHAASQANPARCLGQPCPPAWSIKEFATKLCSLWLGQSVSSKPCGVKTPDNKRSFSPTAFR